jgi:hypothetical protein
MTTLIPKFDLKNGGFTPTGAINRTIYQKLSDIVSVKDYGAVGDGTTDDTDAFNAAIAVLNDAGAANPSVRGVLWCPTATYKIGALTPITAAVTIDFNYSKIIPNTTGVMITGNQNPSLITVGTNDGLEVKNGSVYGGAGAVQPTSIIELKYYGLNPKIENFHVRFVTTTGAMIRNSSGSGLVIRDCTFSDSTCPSAVSFIVSPTDPDIFSNAMVIDHTSISDITGLGIYLNGGDVTITNKSIIEACSHGGISHYGTTSMNSLSIYGCYFEGNSLFDVQCDSIGTYGGTYLIDGCFFTGTSIANHIWVNTNTVLTVSTCNFIQGGVYGTVVPLSYVGINNTQINTTSGYPTGMDAELCNYLSNTNGPMYLMNQYGIKSKKGGAIVAGQSPVNKGVYFLGGNSDKAYCGIGQSFTVTLANQNFGALVSVTKSDDGSAALFYVTYASATITTISDIGSQWATTDTGSLFAIYKSAASFTFTIKNKSTANTSLTVNVLGQLNGATLAA